MPGMIDTIKNAFKIPDLRKKLLLTLGLLVIFRVGCAVPVPGINIAAFGKLVDNLGDMAVCSTSSRAARSRPSPSSP